MKGSAPKEASPHGGMLHEANLVPLTAAAAKAGRKLYNAAGHHEATIVNVDVASDRIVVKFKRNSVIEPKTLSAVSQFWFVKP
jgi:hypothetical protein